MTVSSSPPPRPYPLLSLFVGVLHVLFSCWVGALLPAFFDEWLPVLYCYGLFVEGFERLSILFFFLFSFLFIGFVAFHPMRTLCVLSVGVRRLALANICICI